MPNKLHDAAADKRKGHVTVKELIEINLTDPNEKHTESGRTPITFAAQSGSALTVKYLAKDAQASLDAQQQDKNLMHYAIENSADVLLYTATLHDKFNDGTTELHAAAATGDQLQVEAILAKSPKRINEKNRRGESALYWAAYAGQLSTLAFIRQHDAYRLISEAEYNEDLRTVAEIFHVEATKQHNEAMRNTSGNHLEVAIANYQRAILYRNDIKKKNDSDLKSLSNYYTNLGDAYLIDYTNNAVHKMDPIFKAYTEAKNMAEQIIEAGEVKTKLIEESIAGFQAILALTKNSSVAEERRYQQTIGVNVSQRPIASEVVSGRYDAKNEPIDSVIRGWSGEYKHYANSPSLWNPRGVVKKFADYAAHYKFRTQEDPALAAAIEASRKGALQEAQNLREIAAGHAFNIADQAGDGNCLFHSIAHQLSARKIKPWEGVTQERLREMATQHLTKYAHLYQGFSDHDKDVELKNVQQDRVWADHHAILALARELKVNLLILMSSGGTTIMRQQDAIATLYIGYEVPRHYLSLMPGCNFNEHAKELVDSYIEAEHEDDFKPSDEKSAPVSPRGMAPLPSIPLINFPRAPTKGVDSDDDSRPPSPMTM